MTNSRTIEFVRRSAVLRFLALRVLVPTLRGVAVVSGSVSRWLERTTAEIDYQQWKFARLHPKTTRFIKRSKPYIDGAMFVLIVFWLWLMIFEWWDGR